MRQDEGGNNPQSMTQRFLSPQPRLNFSKINTSKKSFKAREFKNSYTNFEEEERLEMDLQLTEQEMKDVQDLIEKEAMKNIAPMYKKRHTAF